MKCVWICPGDPRNPKDGQQLYSHGLISSLALAGARIAVMTYARAGEAAGVAAKGDVTYRTMSRPEGWRGWSLLTHLPSGSYRERSRAMAAEIERAITPDVDAVILDYVTTGWTLPAVMRRCRKLGSAAPVIVHVAHNHETSLRKKVAASYPGPWPLRAILRLDATKVGRLERRVVAAADIVTAITDADSARFKADVQNKTHLMLTPGYSGETDMGPPVTSATPRRVMMAGSLEWIAKQESLRRFVEAAEAPFAAAGIELCISGRADPAFLRELASGSKILNCIGFVDDLDPWLRASRIGLMPDELGGGFKLRYLSYILNGLPVATIRSEAVGLPLDPDEAMIVGDNVAELTAAIVRTIDDLELLNRKRQIAFESCAGRFDWHERGTVLYEAIQSARRAR